MTPTASRESPELEGPPKRRRTILACNECREKKRKCDGVKPICSACKRRDFSECVWDEERINKVWNNRYIDSLKARIRDLESQQQPLSQNGGDQLGETSISLEEASPIPSSLNQEHMPIDTEAAIPSSHTSPRGQVQTQENREPSLPHDLAVLSCDVPDWNFDMSHPITNKTTSPATNEAGATNEDDEDEVDAMGVISNFPNPHDGRKRKACTYFGPSSTKGLLDKAHGRCPSLSDTCTTPPAHTKENPQNASARSYKSRNDSGVFGMVMPSRPEADGFVESYWRWTHSLYPFIHRPSFEERYLTIWYPHIWTSSSDQSIDSSTAKGIYTNISDRLFYCMLNTVFSLGALFSARIDPEERADVAYSFYERAKKLLDVDLLADGSLALVQTLLLMGQYLQSTEMSNSCWNIIGLAVRVAQCIGLHHDPQNCDQGCCSTQSLDQVEIEMRRRAWTGCIMLDRVLSLTYGRPLMVHSTTSQSQLMLPSPIDDQYLVQSTTNIGSQPEETPSLVDCYIQAVKLQEILGHILTLFYYGNPPCNQEQNLSEILFNSSKEPTNTPRVGTTDIQKILKVDKVLIEWHNKLPAHLKVESYEDGADIGQVEAHNRAIFHRQATILEMRFLHMRLMMLRPVLPIIGDPETHVQEAATSMDTASFGSNIEQDMLLKARAMCMNVAQKQLRIIESGLYSADSLLPPPWYTVFYIHSCAIVLLTMLLLPPNRSVAIGEAPLSAFNRCLGALRVYESQSRTARRCSKSLSRIKQNFFNSLHHQTSGHDKNSSMHPVSIYSQDDIMSPGYKFPGLDSIMENEEMLPASDLSNDDGFYQYAWMPDVSLFSQNFFGDTLLQ